MKLNLNQYFQSVFNWVNNQKKHTVDGKINTRKNVKGIYFIIFKDEKGQQISIKANLGQSMLFDDIQG